MLTQPSTSKTTSAPGFCLTSAGSVPATDAENVARLLLERAARLAEADLPQPPRREAGVDAAAAAALVDVEAEQTVHRFAVDVVRQRQRRVDVGQVGQTRKRAAAHVRVAIIRSRRRSPPSARSGCSPRRACACGSGCGARRSWRLSHASSRRSVSSSRSGFELGLERHERFVDKGGERVEGARGGVLGGAVAKSVLGGLRSGVLHRTRHVSPKTWPRRTLTSA